MGAVRPQDLVFTLAGEYLLERREPVGVRSLIRLLSPFGLSEGAVRTVLSRMAQKGWLESGRGGRRGRYGLTTRGRQLLEAGSARIYHPRWDEPWDGQWFLLAYSIPERERQVRDRLRDRLAWLGFGSLGNGLWLSPHDVGDEVVALGRDLDIAARLVTFRGPAVGTTDTAGLVATCWDLPDVNRRYEEFIEAWVPEFQRCRAELPAGAVSDEECYVLRFRLMHEYRGFPLLDPYLPRVMLPKDWGGECAAHLFRTFHDLLVEPADRHVDAVLASDGPVSARSERPREGRSSAARQPASARKR